MSLREKILSWLGISTKKELKEVVCKIEELLNEQQKFLNRIDKIEKMIDNVDKLSLEEINSIQSINELISNSYYENEQKIQELKENIFDANVKIDKFSKSAL